jgi:hypothetical protein
MQEKIVYFEETRRLRMVSKYPHPQHAHHAGVTESEFSSVAAKKEFHLRENWICRQWEPRNARRTDALGRVRM